MKLVSMDDVECAINNIHNIESISFSDLALVSVGKSKTDTYSRVLEDGNQLFIPLLTVVYDGANILNLTSLDKHFNKFVKKVRDVYLKEKDNPIQGDFFSSYIKIDDYTKKILLSDSVIKTSDLYSFYEGKTGYDELLISNEKEVLGLLSLIIHIIDTNLSMFKKHFTFGNRIQGYGPRGNYVLEGKINNEYTNCLLRFSKLGNNTYNFDLGNVLGDLTPLKVRVSFNKASLDIVCKSDKSDYQLLESYTYNDGEVIGTREAYLNDNLKYSETLKIEKLSSDVPLSKIDEDDSLDWFQLPWGSSIGFKYIDEKVDDEISTSSRKVQYISINNDVFINLKSAEKMLIRKTPDFKIVKDIIFDDVDKTMIGYKDDDITYIRTTFGADGAVGEYNDKYAGKSFYHVSSATSFEELNKSNIYPVGYDLDVYDQGDLLNNFKVKNKARGN